MIQAFVEWRAQTRGALNEVGVEVDVDGVLQAPCGGNGEVRLRGLIALMECFEVREATVRVVVVANTRRCWPLVVSLIGVVLLIGLPV